jgi:CubicO group peptidase (beta-lactamase class C family)
MLERWRSPESIPGRVIPPELADMTDFMNTPQAHRAEIPAAGGIVAARDLARLYACLGAGGTLDGVTLMRPETVATAAERQTFRPDLVLFLQLGWALGYGTGGTPIAVAGPRATAFGHSGYGGSIGFADPEIDMAFGYVPNALVMDIVGDYRAKELADIARACVEN